MAISKHKIKNSRSNGEFSPATGDSLLSDDESGLRTSSYYSSDDDGAFDFDEVGDEVVDSGAESDDFDLSELGEIGAEFCLVGNWNCSVPYELYDLPDLKGVLSLETWNNCLSDEERFRLAEFLPDMEQETYQQTLKELFEGCNFHFGCPLTDLFDRLKGGLCEPRVALYRQGLNFFERHCHYHLLRKYQNSMVHSLFHMKDAWEKTGNCGIDEKLRILEAVKSRRGLMHEKKKERELLGSETDSSVREEAEEGFRAKKAKINHRALYTVRPSSDSLAQDMVMTLEPSKYEKRSRKGSLEVAPAKLYLKKDRLDAPVNVLGTKFSSPKLKSSQMDSRGVMGKDRSVTQRKKDTFLKKYGAGSHVAPGKEENESLSRYVSSLRKEKLHSHGKSRKASLMMDVETLTGKADHYSYPSLDSKESFKPMEKLWNSLGEDEIKSINHKDGQFFSKKSRAYWLAGDGPFQNRQTQQDDLFSVDRPLKFESSVRSKKLKTGGEFQAARKDLVKSAGKISRQVDWTRRTSPELYRRSHAQNSLVNEQERKGIAMSDYVEETESDSSEEVDGDEDFNPSGYVSGTFGSQSSSVRPPADPQQAGRRTWREKRDYGQHIDGVTPTSRKIVDLGECAHMPRMEISPTKRSQAGKNSNAYQEGKRNTKPVQNGQAHDDNDGMLDPLFANAYSAEKKMKGKINPKNSFPLSDYIDKYAHEVLDGDNLPNVNNQSRTHKSWKKDIKSYVTESNDLERSGMPLLGCSSTSQKQKGRVDAMHLDGSDKYGHLQSVSQQPIEDPAFMKKHGKKKLDAESTSLTVAASDSIASEREMLDKDMDAKLPKKPFTLITPSVHTGFSFSIIHLLSAVRRAMTTSHGDDTAEVEKLVKNETLMFPDDEDLDGNDSDYIARKNLPSLTVQEIVTRVKSNPGDPCILETQEPLQDLVRGVLKVFSSKTAPLGAKAWKPLVFYEKSTKNWSWIGPVNSSSLDGDTVVEETSSYAWGLPHKMLVKLVDAFANWLKSGQETLKQIGSLPPPPPMFPNLDEKERFRDLRAQKSLATINPSSDEMRGYFRREEILRYSIPDRAFSYTATDGRKSIVAPLRRSGGKAREHFILKPDRPPHVTILCLVRDAAARLPGSIGTRADVCTLIRDSQYIVENISDAQLNQIVSGALDRLHYERDPCVQFDAERKLWVYLHRDREEEDFEDDGTSSTKKWKRPRKGSAGNPGMGAVNDVCPLGTGDQVAGGSTVASDLNSESAVKQTELAEHDLQANLEENIGQFIDGAQNSIGHPMGWEVLDLNAMRENKIMCLKNSKNEDFDDEQSEGKDQLSMVVQSSMQRMDVT